MLSNNINELIIPVIFVKYFTKFILNLKNFKYFLFLLEKLNQIFQHYLKLGYQIV